MASVSTSSANEAILGASIGISDVVTASVYSKKNHLKKLMMMMMMKMLIIIINIMNKSQETMFLAPELDFRYETKAKKVIVDFKFDALYRYVFIA